MSVPQMSSAQRVELEWCMNDLGYDFCSLIYERTTASPIPLSCWYVESPAEELNVTEMP